MASNQKPGVSPEVFKLLLIMCGVLCLVALAFVPEEYRIEVGMAGTGLLGWAKRAPGDISLTTNVDDIR